MNSLKRPFCHYLLLLFLIIVPGNSRAEMPLGIQSVMVAGAPIVTRHFQPREHDFQEQHVLASVRVATENYGNWGLFLLEPNSLDRTSVGVGYLTNPYVLPVGGMDLELSAGLGIVTGYDFPVLPLLIGEARLVVFQRDAWDMGVAMAAMPYIATDRDGNNRNAGIVFTSPFLGIRYQF